MRVLDVSGDERVERLADGPPHFEAEAFHVSAWGPGLEDLAEVHLVLRAPTAPPTCVVARLTSADQVDVVIAALERLKRRVFGGEPG